MKKPLLAIVLILFLSACQNTKLSPIEPGQNNWRSDVSYFNDKSRHIAQVGKWRYAAKVGLTTPNVREQANLVWEYDVNAAGRLANEIRLFGPLGVGAVRLHFDQSGAVLFDQSGKAHRGNSAEELLNRIIGWPIPIDALSSWLFSIPSSKAPFRYQLNEQQQLAVLEQLAWRIEYSAYRDSHSEKFSEHALPRKIVASRKLPLADAANNEAEPSIVVKLISKSLK